MKHRRINDGKKIEGKIIKGRAKDDKVTDDRIIEVGAEDGKVTENIPGADLVEVFSGIQGEGVLVGARQIFIRFAGCPLECAFCDTPESRLIPAQARFENKAGSGSFSSLPNPVPLPVLEDCLDSLGLSWHHSVSLTGGEPLRQVDFLRSLLPRLKERGTRIFLETNGLEDTALSRVITWLDWISMDLKVPSSTGQAPCWDNHRRFLAAAREGSRVPALVIKAVVTAGTTNEDLDTALELVSAQDAGIPLVLQPASPVVKGIEPPTPGQVLAWQERALGYLKDVRVIPQVHRLLGQR